MVTKKERRRMIINFIATIGVLVGMYGLRGMTYSIVSEIMMKPVVSLLHVSILTVSIVTLIVNNRK